jgi:CheY-like chemotaxis protein
VHADGTRLAQIVGNLLGNAVKFTPRGGHVTLTLGSADDAATLTVADDGPGIAPELLRQIFEPFSQADHTLDRNRGGLGLGLALVQGLTALHGGTVTAHSSGLGQGASFTLRLPLARARAAGAAGADPAPLRSDRRRVLVIEDNRDSAATLQEALELMGHEAQVAHDGAEGLAVAARFAPEVVLCDVGLPGMDGYEVARRLRQQPGMAGAMLVAVTGYASPEDRQRARAAGFTHHLAKPPSLEAIAALVATAAPDTREPGPATADRTPHPAS